MKKLIALMLALLMICVCFVGCTAQDGKVTDEKSSGSDMGANTTEYNDVSTAKILDEVKTLLGEEYGADTDIPADFFESTYGIKPEWVSEYVAQMPMISFNTDTFIAVKAKNGFADKVETALNDFHKYQVENSTQYPANLPKIKAAKVYRLGDYVFYILLGKIPDELVDDEEATYNAAVANNEKVVKKLDELIIKK